MLDRLVSEGMVSTTVSIDVLKEKKRKVATYKVTREGQNIVLHM
jgi:hypothetical protein